MRESEREREASRDKTLERVVDEERTPLKKKKKETFPFETHARTHARTRTETTRHLSKRSDAAEHFVSSAFFFFFPFHWREERRRQKEEEESHYIRVYRQSLEHLLFRGRAGSAAFDSTKAASISFFFEHLYFFKSSSSFVLNAEPLECST